MTNQQGAPEALRLAKEITELMCSNEAAARRIAAAADELCRLHYENQRLAALVEAQQPAPSAAAQIDSALNDYAQAFVARVNGWTKQNGDDLPVARAVLFQAITDYARELAMAASQPSPTPQAAFQQRVQPWLLECFGAEIAADRVERNHRFLEESLELVQSLGCTASEAHQLVDYVFGRAVGDPPQEVGGVMVTLAALCLASGLDMHDAGEVELTRISAPEVVAKIRAKQAAKPKHSPLPQSPPPQADSVLEDASRLTYEQAHAIRQGHEIAASDGYFEARPQIDSNDRRKVFQAGFERGWDAARKQGGA